MSASIGQNGPPADDVAVLTDLGNAERFASYASHVVKYVIDQGRWLKWDGRRWGECPAANVIALAAESARATSLPELSNGGRAEDQQALAFQRSSLNRPKLAASVKLAKSMIAVPSSDLDSDPWLLNCLNGVLDLRNGELVAHSSGRLITKMAEADFDPSAKCPKFEKFLGQIFRDH